MAVQGRGRRRRGFLTTAELMLLSVGRACQQSPDGATTLKAMGKDLMEASRYKIQHGHNFAEIKQRGYVHTLDDKRFALTAAGQIAFDNVALRA